MIERSIYFVITVVVFIIIAFVFIKMFGIPTCESAVNLTAVQLTSAINEVSDENFPTFIPEDSSVDEPTDSLYYTTVPIKMCQEYGTYSYLQSFLGGTPEWQIYYEHFPEGGGGAWNEAYPWGGGAASSFVFWAGLRGITVIGKLAAKATKIYFAWKGSMLLMKAGYAASGRLAFLGKVLNKADKFAKFLGPILRITSPPPLIRDGRKLEFVTSILREKDSNYMIKFMCGQGFVECTWDESTETVSYAAVGDKILLRDDEIPITVDTTVPDGSGGYIVESKQLAVKQNGGGVLDPESADWNDVITFDPINPPDLSNYIVLTINPREEFRKIYEALKINQPANAKEMEEQFAFDDTGSFTETNATNSSYMQKLYNPETGVQYNIETFKKYLNKYSYNVADQDGGYTMQIGNEVATRAVALYNMVNLPDTVVIGNMKNGVPVYASDFETKIIKPILDFEDYKMRDKLKSQASIYGLTISSNLNSQEAVNILREMWEKDGGGLVYYAENDLTNVYVKIKDALIKSMGTATVSDIMNEVRKLNNYTDNFGVYDTRIIAIATDLKNNYSSVDVNNQITQDEFDNFSSNLEERMLKNLIVELGNIDNNQYGNPDSDPAASKTKEIVQTQLGMIVGMFYKDDNAAPIKLWPRSPAQIIKKLVFTQAQRYIAPNNWIVKGFIMNRMTRNCEGNSICVYLRNSNYEYPYYMNESAQQFSGNIRLWRPIDPWKNYAGWTAAIMQVPAHPRFYVVSPCFAVAKVWKTELNGNPTIFVNPVKVDMNGTRSNFCFADSGLINAYTGIWAAGDAATIVEIALTAGTAASGKVVTKEIASTLAEELAKEASEEAAEAMGKKLAQETSSSILGKTLGKWTTFDPITIVQSLAEAYISWPGAPFTSLNLTDMEENKENVQAFIDLRQTLEEQFG